MLDTELHHRSSHLPQLEAARTHRKPAALTLTPPCNWTSDASLADLISIQEVFGPNTHPFSVFYVPPAVKID